MKMLHTLRAVPPPTPVGAAPRLIMLMVYAGFEGAQPLISDLPIAPLALAIAVFMFLQLLANALFFVPDRLTVSRPNYWAVMAAGMLMVPLLLVSSGQAAQLLWMLGAIASVLISVLLVWTIPEDAERISAGRWFVGENAVHAARVRLLSWAIYVVIASGVVAFGSIADWVVFVTLGCMAWHFATSWVIVLMIYVGDIELK